MNACRTGHVKARGHLNGRSNIVSRILLQTPLKERCISFTREQVEPHVKYTHAMFDVPVPLAQRDFLMSLGLLI